jgi:hypothetical protein
MRAKHVGRHWEVVGRDPRVKGEHRSRRAARRQEGAIHLHIRQGKNGGNTLVSIFGGRPKRTKSKKKGKKKGKR